MTNGHVPNGHMTNGHVTNGHTNGPDHSYHPQTSIHHALNNPPSHNHVPTSGHHMQMNGHSHMNGHIEMNNKNTSIDENNANNCNEKQEQQSKEESNNRWGSLKRASKKYHHFRDMISSKLNSKGDGKETDQSNTSQGTNTQIQGHDNPLMMNGRKNGVGREEIDNEKHVKFNTSFRQGPHQHQPKSYQSSNTAETTLTTIAPSQSSSIQPGQSINTSLPPQYPKSPSQYRSNGGPNTPSKNHQGSSNPNNPRHENHGTVDQLSTNRRSGSLHHLAQQPISQHPSWRPHHYSVDNLADTHTSPDTLQLPDSHQLPSDHTYSGPATSNGNGRSQQQQTTEGHGSCGSDSGRGTAGSGGAENRGHDTSLDSATSARQQNQEHSSGNLKSLKANKMNQFLYRNNIYKFSS